jgi:hypothetical protein
MTSTLQRILRRANAILATYGGPQPNIPYLSWCYSEPDVYDHLAPKLWFMSHELDADGQPIHDYYCACGVNRSIHTPTCHSLIAPRIRFTKTKSELTINDSWVCCRWIPPPPESAWIDMYYSLDHYPTQGRYVALSNNGVRVYFHKDNLPMLERLEAISENIVQKHREWDLHKAEILAKVEEKEALKNWRQPRREDNGLPDTWERPPQGSAFAQKRDYFRDRMTQYGQAPGKKQHVSHGGLADIESPNVVAARRRALQVESAGRPIIVLPKE